MVRFKQELEQELNQDLVNINEALMEIKAIGYLDLVKNESKALIPVFASPPVWKVKLQAQ